MVKRADKEYGVWACVRDWSPEEQIACGAQHNELACFWFEVCCLARKRTHSIVRERIL